MYKANLTPENSIGDNAGRQLNKGKFTNNIGQLKTVRVYLTESVATSEMVANALSIRNPNICRCKRKLEKAGQLIVLNKGICKLTRQKADYLTCNLVLLNEGGAIV